MKIKVDLKKIKDKLDAQKAKASLKDPKNSDFVVPLEEGKVYFRAFVYPHSDDPSAEPFLERFYHWGLPGTPAVYCPKKNENKDCHICDFVWEQMKASKGNKEATRSWSQYLPKLSVLLVGKIRGREEEGPKFLRLGSNEKKKSDNHAALYEWFENPDTQNWLDSDEGIDMTLTYAKPDDSQSSFLKGAKFILKKIDLARRTLPFGDDYEKFYSATKNLDSDVYPKKTTEDTLQILLEWRKKMSERKKKTGDEDLNSDDNETVKSFGSEDDSTGKPEESSMADLQAKLDSL